LPFLLPSSSLPSTLAVFPFVSLEARVIILCL
jgi:hypothetical protein